MKRRDNKSNPLIWIISVLVVTSMVCSLVATLRPPRAPVEPTAPLELTIVPAPTDTPTPESESMPQAPTLSPPTRQPQPTPGS